MSGFDENPFSKPNIDDAFSDPAIRRAVSSTPANRVLEDYNPFDQSSQGIIQVRGAANPPIYGEVVSQQPATLQPTNQELQATNYVHSPQQTVNATLGSPLSFTSDQRQESECKTRTEEDYMSHGPYQPERNWPPLPKKCCFQPCFHQDIDVEIHVGLQKVVRQLYHLWMFHGCVLILNVIGGFVLILCNEKFSTFGLGILYLILFTPFSFLCWFRPAYKAFKNDSSFNYMVFFFVFFFQLIVTSIQAIGIPGSGTCGIIMAISMFDTSKAKGIFVGLLLLCIAMCFVLAACGDLLLLTKIHRIYRSSDKTSISKAQQEFATTFLRNEHVQTAASSVVETAVRTRMANAANPTRF